MPLSEALRETMASQSVSRTRKAQEGLSTGDWGTVVCTPQASHDAGKLLEGANVGRDDAVILDLLLAGGPAAVNVRWASSERGVRGSRVLVFPMQLPRLMMPCSNSIGFMQPWNQFIAGITPLRTA